MWWILILVVCLIISYLLFAKIIIEINSNEDLYCLKFGGIFGAALIVRGGSIKFEVKIAGWKKIIEPGRKAPVEEKHPVAKRAGKKMEREKVIRKIKGVLLSFRLKSALFLLIPEICRSMVFYILGSTCLGCMQKKR